MIFVDSLSSLAEESFVHFTTFS